ncbi:VOC family protein [Saccharopolyspora shandongensis]|uniref:VOC family protein n=1 Tax=Saccharopolyspora shandongensis TaxID=418495 RepID=UPI0033D63200
MARGVNDHSGATTGEALAWRPRPGEARTPKTLRTCSPRPILSRRDEPEQGKPWLHIDVNATDRDQDAELERLLKLGARPADIGQAGEKPWHVLADPDAHWTT